MMTKSKLMVLGVFLVAVQGCQDCGTRVLPNNKGEARIIYTVDGAQLSGDDGIYDFGTVSMGKTVTKPLVVQNSGLGALVIRTFTKTSGDAAKAGTDLDEPNPVFTIAFTGETTVAVGDSVEFPIDFSPPVVEGVAQVVHETVLSMTSANTAVGKENASITLKGVAVSGECDLPAVIDFGAVARGDTFNVEYVFVNQRPIETHAYLGAVESAQGDGIFVVSADSPRGEFLIGGQRSKTATIAFKPTEAREYAATIRMRRADGCPEKPVRLIGTGVAAVLSWTPALVDFGYAPPGTTVPGEVTFSNLALTPVTLTALATREGTNPSAVYKVTEAQSATELTTLTVPGGMRDTLGVISPGTAKVKLSFKPIVLGPRAGQMVATTALPSQPMLSVNLRGVGGGPDIEARPAPVMPFGRIAYFPAASPATFASKKLVVQNMGTRPTLADSRANLKLGQSDGAGGFTRPYWEVTPKPGSSMDEICLGMFDTVTNACSNDLPATGAGRYDPAVGLEAGAGTSILEIPVRITPNGFGMREFEVKLFSNDPDEPITIITVTANSVMLPPCDVEITPIALSFGIVSPPAIRDLAFTVRNRLTGPNDLCLMSNLQLMPEVGTPTGMPAVFSLPGGVVNELELMPNETKQVMVRAWPQGMLPPTPAQVSGRVSFNLADPVAPQREVALTATIANSCLTISPSTLDFGVVKKDCNSPNRNFQIYNSCSTDVVINSSQMGSAAGEGPGGPNCPGTAPCPEFFVVTGISGGTRVTPGSSTPVTFSLKYRPINYGPDTGAFVISVTQAGQPLDYVVALQGRGDTLGLNTDTFRQDTKPKADILLAIDKSGSMSDKQVALAQNMNSFLQYATSNQVDFQLAVTNTELNEADRGTFNTSAAGNKILRPTTPNLASEFTSIVVVPLAGGTESCMEPATRALTAPYITDPARNAGFLRQEAVLAIVCVTDARDQAPQAPAFYLNQLINIKGAQRSGQFTYNVVGPFLPSSPSGCIYDDANDGRHEFMVSQTNGVKEEICTPNWAVALENIGKNAFGYRTNFFLTSRPDLAAPTGIQVSIDGMPIPAIDPDPNLMSRIWEYDATNNSINFEPLYVPEPGKTLTVTYQTACIP
ncbi:MAG: hypothetical protein Q8L48_10770 [Archangium sp.]|nr:hypothetical protein [Archangium sp.]